MFSPSFLVVTLTLALAVAANPLYTRRSSVTLPIAKRVNATGTVKILERDQARARRYKQSKASKRGLYGLGGLGAPYVDVDVTTDYVTYLADVSIIPSTVIQ